GWADAARPLGARDDAQLRVADRLAQARHVLGARDRDDLGSELLALLHAQVERAARGQCSDSQSLGEARHEVERLCADRARGAQEREPLHDSASRCWAGVRPKRRSRCWNAHSASASFDLLKSGQSTSLVKNSVYASCQSRKFEMRCSPPVRIRRSGSGMSLQYRLACTHFSSIASGSSTPPSTARAICRTASTIS